MIALLILLVVGGMMHAAGTFATDAGTAGTLLAFGYLLLVAYFGGRVVSRLGLPQLTGYLLAGVVSGPFVLDLVTSPMTAKLRVVNGVATCILGLVAGAELNLARVRPIARTLVAIMIFGVIGTILVLTGVLYGIRSMLPIFDGLGTTETLVICGVLAVALIPQSPAIVMALISETRADGPVSQLVLAAVVVADLVVVVIYSLVAAVGSALLGAGVDVAGTALAIGWELLGSVAFGVAIGMLLGLFVRAVKDGAPLFALMVCIVVAEIGVRIHLDPLIVMLTAGIWLENFSRADASSLVHRFESAQLPVFLVWFALAGMRLDLIQLYELALPVGIIAAARALSLYGGTTLACMQTNAAAPITRYGWIGLLPQAGLSLALVVVIQSSFPAFGGFAALLMLSVLGLNQMIAPVLLRIAFVRSGEAGKKVAADFATSATSANHPP
ncbi:MAG: cation:proton antiporter [Deltaproteobacteria bacterium]|nr:cation:proton antiporter [Deltaproteobacteria bacterium]MDQ3298200.1 cation:proton antiporter [Myxococcota bacterium]